MNRWAPCALALLLCEAASSANAQSYWQWIHPAPQGNALNDVDVQGPDDAVAVGDLGTVLRSGDGGRTWSAAAAITGLPALHGVSFAGGAAIVAVGSAGKILVSIDGGSTWNEPSSGTSEDLLEVDFTDASHGTTVGTHGTILRTADGGSTWSPQASGTTAALFGVRFVDVSTGTAVGAGGVVLRTVDGGTTWVPQNSGTTLDLVDVDFADVSTGMAVGTAYTSGFPAPYIIGTMDGGATWSPQPVPAFPLPIDTTLRSVCMSDATHGFAVGTYEDPYNEFGVRLGLFMSTEDGGASWQWGKMSAHLNGLARFSGSEGLAVGAAGLVVRMTPEGGAPVAGGDQNFTIVGVDFFDWKHGVAVASEYAPRHPADLSSRVYTTRDGGATWTLGEGPFVWNRLLDVAFADSSTVYAVGHGPHYWEGGGTIWRSDDGGSSWGTIFSVCCPPCGWTCFNSLQAVDFAGPGAGVAVGSEGAIVTIRDGVATWISSPTLASLYAVSVLSEHLAYAVGDSGAILRGSLDEGSWVRLPSPISQPLYDVCFTDETHGTIVGPSGMILRTTDGGASWTPQSSAATGSITSVSFLDPDHGIALQYGWGTPSLLLKTNDGGATWVPEALPLACEGVPGSGVWEFAQGGDVVYVDPRNVVATGGNESILMRRDIAVPVLFQDVAAVVRSHAVELHWALQADETLRGFQVYRSGGGGLEPAPRGARIAPSERSFLDADVAPGASYEYRVAAVDECGSESWSRPIHVDVPQAMLALFQNDPNPFNPTTRIRFVLPAKTRVHLDVFDVAGRRVAALVDDVREAGEHEVSWRATDAAGMTVGSGIYLCKLRTSSGTVVRKMTHLK
jgi:photosystem II stability/assembly factor-like uncharacterized protein